MESITLGVGQIWSPVIEVSAPTTASGDDEGILTLTLSLDSDPSISIVGILPVEANRTRGLSILGPEGLPSSSGVGFPGTSAMAWIMIENLGNAAENQILRTWGSTEWGDDLRLYDPATGDEIIGMSPQPYSTMEVYASLEVPGVQYGENVSTLLELCVGQEMTWPVTKLTWCSPHRAFVIEPPHRRMVPGQANYTIKVALPTSSDSINWSISDLGMSLPVGPGLAMTAISPSWETISRYLARQVT